MNYKKELAKLNATEEDLRKNKKMSAMAESIDDLLETQGIIEGKIKAGDGDIDELQSDLAEVKNDIKALDEKLTGEIPAWHKKKSEFIKKMQDAQAKKYSTQSPAPETAPASPVAKKQTAPKATVPTPTPTPAAPVVTAPVVEAEKKKGNSGAFILFGVLALVVTVGAVNLLKNK